MTYATEPRAIANLAPTFSANFGPARPPKIHRRKHHIVVRPTPSAMRNITLQAGIVAYDTARIIKGQQSAPMTIERERVRSKLRHQEQALRNGLGLIGIGVVGALTTLIFSSAIIPLAAGVSIFTGSVIAADAVERIRRGD